MTTVSCAPSRTCAGTAATRCAPDPGSDLRELRVRLSRLDLGPHRRAQAGAQPQGLRRAADGGLAVVPGAASTRGRASSSSISTSTPCRLRRLPGGRSRRHRVERAGRLPVLRDDDHRGRRQLEDHRRRLQRDLPHPDAAPRTPPVHGRRLCAADRSGVTRASPSSSTACRVRAIKDKLTDAEVWDAYVATQGALMGVAEDTPFPADQRGPGQIGCRRHRRSDKGFRRRSRCRPELGHHRPDDAAAPVQRVPEHDAADQRRPPDGDDRAPGRRSRPRRTGDAVVDADAARRTAEQARRHPDDRRRGPPGSGAHPGHHGAARASARPAPAGASRTWCCPTRSGG